MFETLEMLAHEIKTAKHNCKQLKYKNKID